MMKWISNLFGHINCDAAKCLRLKDSSSLKASVNVLPIIEFVSKLDAIRVVTDFVDDGVSV